MKKAHFLYGLMGIVLLSVGLNAKADCDPQLQTTVVLKNQTNTSFSLALIPVHGSIAQAPSKSLAQQSQTEFKVCKPFTKDSTTIVYFINLNNSAEQFGLQFGPSGCKVLTSVPQGFNVDFSPCNLNNWNAEAIITNQS